MRTLQRIVLVISILLLGGFVFTVPARTVAQPDDGRIPMQDLILSAGDLTADIEKGTSIIGENLVPESITGASLTSRVIEAPMPFNAVVPQWTGRNADAVTLQVRTSADGENWSDWVGVEANRDWMEPGEPEIVGQMVLVADDDSLTHQFVQVQIVFDETGEAADLPTLSSLRLTFIDTSEAPTTEELVDLQSEIDKGETLLPESIDAYPKPPVVSRKVWCTKAACNYTAGLRYHPVSHLIIHHTVSANSSPNWAATVLAIWNYHTYSRGWGDIGYNYLIDPNGVIYEGHNGGDDVVGAHASGANVGSMGVALLGTFTAYDPGIRPPQPMLDAAVELLSWKAAQRHINVFDAGRTLPNVGWGVPFLSGHRDVYGTTECPGDQAHLLIPWLREQIASRIGLVDPFIYADEQSAAFNRSSTGNWLVPRFLCGFNNHAWFTWSTNKQGSSTNWGEWRPRIPTTGRYRIDVYVPYCYTGRGETSSAVYTIQHAKGTSTRVVDQQANVGLWITLGEYTLNQGNGNVIRLTDLTSDSGLGVWFDAIRLLPVGSPPPPAPSMPTNVDPATNAWRTSRTVNFAWQITNPELVEVTTLQVATDPGFVNVLVNQSWYGAPTTHTHTFGSDYASLYWRVLLARPNTPLVSSQPTRFALDATPPKSAVSSPVYYLPGPGRYAIQWNGSDALSGIDRFNIDFRPAGGVWTRWLTNMTGRAANFTPPVAGQIYEFRAQAIDRAGNIEPEAGKAQATTANAVTVARSTYLHIIAK